MRYFSVLAAAFVLTACIGPLARDEAAVKAPLDNKTFTALVTRDGKAEPDELVFKNGTFRSTTSALKGFAPATYTTVKQGEFMKFEAVATSPTSGTMKWTGKVKGEAIEGTAVLDPAWWRPDREYPFKGKLKD